ncbi:MAG: hypothetical protein GY832_23600 [Chloroflexi bacterium]|nr:hypothetical protein [Chloroflexota bacterium]
MSDAIIKRERTGLEVLGTTEQMTGRLALNSERLRVVHEFIAGSEDGEQEGNFIKGIDYGRGDPRSDKLTLLKPGAEKVCKLFGTRPKWRMDEDTWRMLGEPKGTVCYLCELVDNSTGEVIGEGRGANRVGSKKTTDENNAVKIAEKRALVDAALNTFGLSDKFTQDIPDDKKSVTELGRELMRDIESMRADCPSSMSNRKFFCAVAEQAIGKKTVETPGEMKALRQAIERGDYVLETGERIGR